MSKNTAKITDPIWDSRNSDEPAFVPTPGSAGNVPTEGELWGRNGHPLVMILRPQGKRQYLLATINVKPGQKSMTRAELTDYLENFEKIGAIFPPYAYSHETPSQPLWNAEDMRDYAKATLTRFEQELEKQRMHFFRLEDPRAEGIYNVLAVVQAALQSAINPPNIV